MLASSLICASIVILLLVQGTLCNAVVDGRRNTSRVCYHPYGCYSSTGKFSHFKVPPASPIEINTTFTLYEPGTEEPIILNHGGYSKASKTYNEVYFLVHGFGYMPRWMDIMRDALNMKNISVVVVDWTGGSRFPNYYQAASNSRVTGAVLGDMIQQLVEKSVFRLQDITLVGFSLGAHVCGFAGKRFSHIPRIIGLDPAGPLFTGQCSDARLASTDAALVQCVHTNGLSLLYGGLGTVQQMGHTDFYANGGLVQVGCAANIEEVVLDLWTLNSTLFEELTCSHGRAPYLFIESIRSSGSEKTCKFTSVECNSANLWHEGNCFQCLKDLNKLPAFGFTQNEPAIEKGKFYFATLGGKDSSPYCGKQYGVSIQSDRWVKGNLVLIFVYKSGANDTFQFLLPEEELQAESQAIKMVALSEPYSEVYQVGVSYEKYTSWLWKNGPDMWMLQSVILTGLGCEQHVIRIKIYVSDRETKIIKIS